MVSVHVKNNAGMKRENNEFVRIWKELFSKKVAFKILTSRREGDGGFLIRHVLSKSFLNSLGKHLRMRRNNLLEGKCMFRRL